MAKADDKGMKAVCRLLEAKDPAPEHARHVTRNALRLFDLTAGLHGLGKEERRLLEAGALLHDIGLADGALQHHKRARDLILKADLPGFTKEEIKVIACLARYHRKAFPAASHAQYKDLSEERRAAVCKLAALLRIADGLDRSHTSSTAPTQFSVRGKLATLRVEQEQHSEVDIWGGLRKRVFFESVFGLTLDIVLES